MTIESFEFEREIAKRDIVFGSDSSFSLSDSLLDEYCEKLMQLVKIMISFISFCHPHGLFVMSESSTPAF